MESLMTSERPTVLVVEDDDSMRLLCRLNLELEGYRVLEADRVPKARELIDSEQIDLILLDVHVGGDHGYDLIEPAREEKGIPIALLTGTAQVGPEDRKRVDAALPKPFNLEDLMATVRGLARSQAAR
jgi:DNA-binding response OmpR family regulator